MPGVPGTKKATQHAVGVRIGLKGMRFTRRVGRIREWLAQVCVGKRAFGFHEGERPLQP